MSKKVIAAALLFFAIVIGVLFVTNKKRGAKNPLAEGTTQTTSAPAQTQVVDKQASFAIFTNGTFRIFTATMYHNLSENVYIEASNPNIVRVKKTNITWNDFFSTLPFKLSQDCLTTGTNETFCTGSSGTLKFYLNGEEKPEVLNLVIESGDKLLVTFGKESTETIKKQLDEIPNP